jgi:protein gp37
MGDKSDIEWTDATWNPTRGCTRVSEGCRNCYAERLTARMSTGGGWGGGFAKMVGGEPRWTGVVRFIPERLDEPLHWKRPRRVFVNSMSDLFHEHLNKDDILRIFMVMRKDTQHTFQVLTKRPERMLNLLTHWLYPAEAVADMSFEIKKPAPNIWLGVSVEDHNTAAARIPLLLKTPAAKRFVSYEPALGPVNFRPWRFRVGVHMDGTHDIERIDWIIVGGESGPGARPFNIEWARDTIAQTRTTGVRCFVKQLGAHPCFRLQDEEGRGNKMPGFHHSHGDLLCKRLKDTKGGDMSEWPEDLRVREYPT